MTIPDTFNASPDELAALDASGLRKYGGLDGLVAKLHTDASHGIEDDRWDERKAHFGDNRLPPPPSKSFFQFMFIAMQDKMLLLLCAASIASLGLGIYQRVKLEPQSLDFVEGVAILGTVLIIVLASSAVDYTKQDKFKKLNAKNQERKVKVKRAGKVQELLVFNLLVGDVVLFEAGDLLPADGVLIDGHNVSCDESSATGESEVLRKVPAKIFLNTVDETKKSRATPFLISGSKISEGVGSYLVTAVGTRTQYGKMMASVQQEAPKTPLQVKLDKFAGHIAIFGLCCGAALFLGGFVEFLVHLKLTNDGERVYDGNALGQKFSRILILAFSMIAVSVPEGLPLAVTLSLSFATQQMTKAKLLVRNLKSCETMGHATVILTDKTGTLTQNSMTVVGMTMGNGTIRAGVKAPPLYENGEPCVAAVNEERSIGPFFSTHIDPYWRELLKQLVAFNSTAQEVRNYTDVTYLGNSTEVALLRFAQSYLGLGHLEAEKSMATVVNVFPFDSRKKSMGVVILENDGRYRVLLKGSPEAVLARCTKNNRDPREAPAIEPLSSGNLLQIKNVIDAYASMSLRMIGLAYAELEQLPEPKVETGRVEFDQLFHDLTWIGAAAIQDPLRDEVPRAISNCERAGVRVIMVTGDNKSTAESIARECGILKHDGLVLEGVELRSMPAVERKNATKNLCVVARCSPEDKKLLVEAFKDRSYVVAVTGDGTNDGPALKAAHVGFSMGQSGTEIAKEASDIVLMNDDFAGIVEALKWGRCINDSVKKFLQFQLSVNLVAAAFTIITYFADLAEPVNLENTTTIEQGHKPVISAVQLLWVNLIMDTLAALALATDRPDDFLLDRPAESWKANLISPSMFRLMGSQTLFQLPVLFIIWFGRHWWALYNIPEVTQRDPLWRTFLFNVFVFLQITNCVNSRSLTDRKNIFYGVYKNIWFVGTWLLMILGQVIIVEWGGPAFDAVRLSGELWGITLAFSVLPLLVGYASRMVPAKYFVPWNCLPQRSLRLSSLGRRPATIEQGRFPDMWKDISEVIKDDLTFHRRLRGGRNNRIAAALVAPSIMASAPAGT